uniref:Uncharacterized protein n=1 Tax=Sphenodon punctatus TaxID=8508 RepID=A0A8D0L200_SPHPU
MEPRGTAMQELLLEALDDLDQEEFDRFKFNLRHAKATGGENIPRGRLEKVDRLQLVELLVEFYEDKAAMLMVTIFEEISLKNNASKLRKALGEKIQGYKKKYAESVMEDYQLVEDRNALFGESVPLDTRYIHLLIIRKHRLQKQKEHELAATGRRHLEVMEQRNSIEYLATDIGSFFEPSNSGLAPRTVVLQGPAGIGKTMTTQKIMLGWASGELYQDMFDYVFCIRCRDLSLTEKASSLADLIVEKCQDMYAPVRDILAQPEKLLFIIDGFDELSFSLEPQEHNLCVDPYAKVPMESILNSLLRKKLLPKSYLLITTRPGALEKLQKCLKAPQFTEILGFSEKGRQEYFSKFFPNERDCNRALRFVKNTGAISTICFIPMVCWIVCSVIRVELETEDEIGNTLDTTTKVFVQFAYNLLKHHSKNWQQQSLPNELWKLCSLARAGILEQKLLFEEDDLREHNLDASDLRAMFLDKSTFQKGIGCHSLYSFVHLCFQEFFAALFYILQGEPKGAFDNPEEDLKRLLAECEKPGKGHLLLTLRFLFGLSSTKVQEFLEQAFQCETSGLVKSFLLQKAEEMAAEEPPRTGYRLLEFFHCLFESQEAEFARRVMHHFQNIDLSFKVISLLDCRVLAFCLQHSSNQEHSLNLTYCRLTSHHVQALAPGIQNCAALEFGSNKLGNVGVTILCAILKKPECKVSTLSLNENYLTDACAQELCSTLSSSHTLYQLNLDDNSFTDKSLPFILHLMWTCNSLTILSLERRGFSTGGDQQLKVQEEKIKETGRQFLRWG